MTDTLNQLNDFLKNNSNKVKQKTQDKELLKIRNELLKDKKLVEIIEAFIVSCPDELNLNREQLEYLTYTFMTYLISTKVIKIFKNKKNGSI